MDMVFDRNKFLNAEEAKAIGFIDKIIQPRLAGMPREKVF